MIQRPNQTQDKQYVTINDTQRLQAQGLMRVDYSNHVRGRVQGLGLEDTCRRIKTNKDLDKDNVQRRGCRPEKRQKRVAFLV